jgi:murein endopeptidase
VNGEQLPPHRAYVIRNDDVAWGTNETISAVLDGFDAMVERFDDLPRVRVHDLSREDGGYLAGHRSHQSGRDADIGYYHDACGDECAYIAITGDDLDVERQWWLFRYWINNDLIEYVFVDYDLQRTLYAYVDEVRGATDDQLREWFQYPRGRDTAVGLIRHEPNHADHLHVRFACAGDDDRCR